jgi:hypothetical protein
MRGRLQAAKDFAVIWALALVAVSCSRGVSRVQTHSLATPNPTAYSFPLPLTEVHAKALEAFSIEHQVKEPVFVRPTGADSPESSFFSVECATNAVMGKDIFNDPANAHDIYLHTFHSPFVLSSVYRGRYGGLPFIATFHLHLTDSGTGTLVSVTASNAEIINGTKFGFGSCGPGQGWNCEGVAPTTVEEYSILRYLGRSLGVTNMPAVIVPAP